MTGSPILQPALLELSDEEAIRRVLQGEIGLYEIIMRRYNQRLYRVARAILRDDGEAEDVMQEAYVRAYQHLGQFAGKAAFSTWLTRIAVNEALARKRRRGRQEGLEVVPTREDRMATPESSSIIDPESRAAQLQIRELLEDAIGALPEDYRTIIILRDVEELDVAETAASLGVSESVVKTRLHRARAVLRKELYARSQGRVTDLYPFHAPRCNRVVQAVFARIREQNS